MASGTRGYSSYRGRGRKGKIFLAIVLILIILASAGFIIAREHMTYDADGNLHFDLPWTKGPEPSDQLPETPDVKIQKPEASEDTPAAVNVIQAVQLGEDPAQWQAQLSAGAYNAFAVTMKASDGTLEYPFETSVSGRKLSDRAAAVQEALPRLLDGERYSIARLSCLRDGGVARENLESMGLKNTGGYVFYDGNNENWLDPSKEAVKTYLSDLAVECADLGFDEILLTDLSYPTVGKLDKIDYGFADGFADQTAYHAEQIADLLRAIQEALAGRDVKLSLEVPEAAYEHDGIDSDAGLDLYGGLMSRLSRVYVPTAPEKADGMVTEALGNGVLTWKLRTPLSLVITAVSPRIPALIRGESRSVFNRASWSSLLAIATTTVRCGFHGER